MSQTVAPGAPYTSRFAAGMSQTGLTGTIRFRLLDIDHTVDDPVYGPSAVGIVEDPTGSGSYVFVGTAPTTAGVYAPAWDSGPDTELFYDEDLIVAYTAAEPGMPAGRDLCSLSDVLQYLPGYRESETVAAKLQAFITAESQAIHEETDREIRPLGEQPATRTFDLGPYATWNRRVEIGDLASTAGLAVSVLGANGDTTETVDTDAVVPLYSLHRRYQRQEWEPIVALAFPRYVTGHANLRPGTWSAQTLSVTGTWGFPEVPAFIREACAKRVILRYVSDVAASDLTDALDSLNLAAMWRSAQDAIELLQTGIAFA